MSKKTYSNTNSFNLLYTEKEKINKLITNISDKEIEERLDAFKPPFDELRKILEKMGKILFKFIILYFEEKKEENIKDFKFYFWPGFTTLENQRVFIWGSKIYRANQKYYYTGVGWDNSNKKEEIKDCPTTLSYDHVLNGHNYEGSVLHPGSTHNFRINQSKDKTGKKKEYLKLRIQNKDGNNSNVFKALHITTDESFKESVDSKYTLHIKLNNNILHESGPFVKGKLDKFLKQHNNMGKDENYRWKWPFDVFPYEERVKKEFNNDISQEDLLTQCEEYQQKVIDIQTHLYSYWIAETLGDGSTFRDEEKKKKFKQKLHMLLAEKNLSDLEAQFGFFDKIDIEKGRIKIEQKKYKEIYFKHWYTIYNDGYSVEEDLGSTMLLTSHSLSPDLLNPISVWIEDIYNNLKLVESKTIAEDNMRKDDFSALYHIQGPYFTLFRKHLKEKNCSDMIPIVDIMDYMLRITRNIHDPEELKRESHYDETKEMLNIVPLLEETITQVNSLCKDNTVLKSMFGIDNNDEREHICRLSENNSLFCLKQFSSIEIESHKQLFKILITEILINAVKHSIKNNPDINILILVDNTNLTLMFQNSSIIQNQEELNGIRGKSKRFGLSICEDIAKALNIGFEFSMIENNVANVRLTKSIKKLIIL
ncbi:hypothetical protein FACS1894145_0330 [Bacteroidia bacterium]|nr:hypothetical protein FACS1894145_0330 [Bacteroidia bacterium]